ncbi:hypothetical protein chiPu_0000465 [Chiloscyllium punctatum]|uniref:Uncharacterized protein n=1 Tax=Chiloscyllium punctatum TaxID=137246 RepID=A0A401RVA0_CHIPU|nr:hypothetical protein [Chiloscyllium punctatum]
MRTPATVVQGSLMRMRTPARAAQGKLSAHAEAGNRELLSERGEGYERGACEDHSVLGGGLSIPYFIANVITLGTALQVYVEIGRFGKQYRQGIRHVGEQQSLLQPKI